MFEKVFLQDMHQNLWEIFTRIRVSAILTQDDFFICKAEEGGVAVATATDVGAADEKSVNLAVT